MVLAVGDKLGPYEIVAPLGAGGMGEVYRARDSKLDRDVAIKVLPAGVAADPERLARFEREAKTLASLNHPNIAHVHGIEEAPSTSLVQASTRAIVMELVEGEDLAQRIARGRACGQLRRVDRWAAFSGQPPPAGCRRHAAEGDPELESPR